MKKYLRQCCLPLLLTALVSAGELPDDVQRLIDKRGEAIAQIDLKFVKELEKLKTKYTKAGDLDSANAIVALIEKTPVMVVDTDSGIPRKDLIEGAWKQVSDGKIWTFDDKGGGGGQNPNNTRFKVIYDTEKKHFLIKSARWTDIASYGSDFDTLDCISQGGVSYQLRRIK